MKEKVINQVGIYQPEKEIHLAGLRGVNTPTPQVVYTDAGDYYVGEGVEYITKPLSGFSFERLHSETGKAVGYAGLSELLLPGNHDINLMLGVPIDAWKKRDEVHKAWKGTHEFECGGKYILTVENVLSLPQPGAALYGVGGESGLVMVIDIGFNTTDMFAMRGAMVEERYIEGCSGIKHAVEYIQSSLKAKYDIGLSSQEIDRILRGDNEVYVNGEVRDVSGLINSALQDTANHIADFMSRVTQGNVSQFRMLLVGGGSVLLHGYLSRMYPLAELVPDPVFAVARGLHKAAAQKWGEGIGLDPGFGAYKLYG